MDLIEKYVDEKNVLQKRLDALGLCDMEREVIMRLPVNDKCRLNIVNKLLLDKIKGREEKGLKECCKSSEKGESCNN